eukprot:TRINITY_DN30744_c0_g1_i2.p1 TRINITY_DN30744_c0_g1~~TRINITY_DN30744_c0_g1_i2.p1  ORF type:complete len:218 (+),score=48.00 TRINITY_DN30744_c0_g1_i2:96-656(+)
MAQGRPAAAAGVGSSACDHADTGAVQLRAEGSGAATLAAGDGPAVEFHHGGQSRQAASHHPLQPSGPDEASLDTDSHAAPETLARSPRTVLGEGAHHCSPGSPEGAEVSPLEAGDEGDVSATAQIRGLSERIRAQAALRAKESELAELRPARAELAAAKRRIAELEQELSDLQASTEQQLLAQVAF